MQKIITLFILTVCGTGLNAQETKSALGGTEIVWFGLDFTKAKFIGSFEHFYGVPPATGADMKNKWIPNWNSLVITEDKNFDLKGVFRMENIILDLKSTNELNKKIDTIDCMAYNPGVIERKDIEIMVNQYRANEKKEGVGLVFIVENFNRPKQIADVYVTFFDIATRKVLICEKVSGKPEGVTMRNYWAGAIKDILKIIKNKKYKIWRSKYP